MTELNTINIPNQPDINYSQKRPRVKIKKYGLIRHAKCVLEQMGTNLKTVKKPSKKMDVTALRYCAIYFLIVHKGYSYTAVANLFERDRTTVIHAVKKIKDYIDCKDHRTIKALSKIESLQHEDKIKPY
jgi:chromosomal replication initiation ATPase DnaA